MKKRVNFKLEFKKERITKLNDLYMIKGATGNGNCGGSQTIEDTDPRICLTQATIDC